MKTKTFYQNWKCPKCGTWQQTLRRKTSIDKRVMTFCYGVQGEGCFKYVKIEVKQG